MNNIRKALCSQGFDSPWGYHNSLFLLAQKVDITLLRSSHGQFAVPVSILISLFKTLFYLFSASILHKFILKFTCPAEKRCETKDRHIPRLPIFAHGHRKRRHSGICEVFRACQSTPPLNRVWNRWKIDMETTGKAEVAGRSRKARARMGRGN